MNCKAGGKKSQGRYNKEMAEYNDNVIVSIIPIRGEEIVAAHNFSRQQDLHCAVGVKQFFVFHKNVEYEEAEIDRQN
ncbi:hypothetical protein MesoLj113a_57460 [Mesorhizobium sp. 113-1-2]|nr:Glycoside hydrolase [Mesorhizobium loti]BCG74588.1 hypothetical protein MesoLj113a_57460 [Mesorhizobium sp. 113-1-2]